MEKGPTNTVKLPSPAGPLVGDKTGGVSAPSSILKVDPVRRPVEETAADRLKTLRGEFMSANGSQDSRTQVEILDKMQKISPKSREFLESQSRSLVEARNLDKALPFLNECVTLFPDSETCLVDRADVLGTKGTKDEQALALDACLKIHPQNMLCRNMIGILRMNQGKFPEAVTIYESLIHDNGNFGVRFSQYLLDAQIAFAFEGAGRINEALEAFEKSCASGRNEGACQSARSLREKL